MEPKILKSDLKIALVAYMFPPMSGGGVQRMLSLSNYLAYRSNIWVVTEDVSNYSYDVYDSSVYLNKNITLVTPSGICLLKSRLAQLTSPRKNNITNKKYRRSLKHKLKTYISWFLPDNKVRFMFGALKSFLKHVDCDIVIASVRPPSNAVVGYLYSLFKGKPLIIEYRDLWFGQEFQSSIASPIQYLYEYLILSRAAKILVVSPAYKKVLSNRYPGLKDKIELLTNGFDSSILDRINVNKVVTKKFSHFGRFYGPRRPDIFIEVLNKHFTELKLEHYGPLYNYSQESFVNCGHLSFKEAWELQASVDSGILLVIESTSDNIPGKLFEYYATGKPILCIVPESSVIRDLFSGIDRIVFSNLSEVQIVESIHRVLSMDKIVRVEKSDKFSRDSINENYWRIVQDVAKIY